MRRLAFGLLALLCTTVSFGQSGTYANRQDAPKGLSSPQAAQRAEAVTWIANHGTPADGAVLARRLTDESPLVRAFAE